MISCHRKAGAWSHKKVKCASGGLPTTCKTCWKKSDLEDKVWDKFPAKDTYTKLMLRERIMDNPFSLEQDKCNLNCKKDFWSNSRLPIEEFIATETYKCISVNCRDWDHNDPDSDSTKCSKCWSWHDIRQGYFTGKDYYNISRANNPPFIHDNENKRCLPLCKLHYIPTFAANFNPG